MTTRPWTDEYVASLRNEGDPPADDAVAAYFRDADLTDPARLMAQLVRHTRVPPEERDAAVGGFLDRPETPPPWQDDAQLRAGQAVFDRYGLHVFAALNSASLPVAYAGWKGVHVLHLTARLATDTKRRLVETAQFVLDVTSPGGLDAGGVGIGTVRHVRLMHAAVRWLIRHDPRVVQGPAPETVPHYDPAWGVPVCQADLLNTLLTFTQVVFDVFDRTGVVATEDERDAYLHLWNVVGFHLGVRPDLLPLDRDDLRTLTDAMPHQQFGSSAAGREMTVALLDQSQEILRWPLRGLPVSMTRHCIGADTADLLEVPPADWTRHLYGPMAAVSRAIRMPTVHDRLLARLSGHLARATLTHAVVTARAGDRPDFALPTHLASRWGVDRSVARHRRRAGTPA